LSLWELSLRELRDRLAVDEVGAEETVRVFLDRIDAKDGAIGAFLAPLRDEALERARKLDRLPREERGPLHGIPVAIKDVLSLEGSPCTAGSRILENYVAPYSATAIARLLGAGAVVVGRTNLDEFAMGSSTENSSFHVTRNPWDLDRVPGGSSGGSAAAVAARLATAALGTDTGGSIRQPAALCGIVGLKPTYGRVSRYGLLAYASSFDQIGPLASTAEDAAIVLDAIAGPDPRDSTCTSLPVARYAEEIGKSVRTLRVGVPRDVLGEGVDASVLEAFENAVRTMENLGAEVEEISLPSAKHAIACYYVLATAEASSNLARYDGVRYGLRSPASGLREMMAATRDQGFGREVKRRILLGTFVLSAGYYDAYYEKAQRVRSLVSRDFARAFETVDALLLPTTPEPAFPIGAKAEDPLSMYLADVFTVTANLAGVPALSFPAGFDPSGLPIGMQLVGRHFEEATILRLAHAFQGATDFHSKRPPAAD
jgi:aspartyl-tRNA(Asn)/glutamyl-tRNA(Gln) amidotransferase subunit A